jgi:hypothetical protein
MKACKCCLILMLLALSAHAISQTPQAALGPVQEPTWPQAFEIHDLQVISFVFAVTQPGPVAVGVQSQGVPLNFTVHGPLPSPGASPSSQSGSGTLRWAYNVTPQDLQHGMFWQIELRLAQQTPAPVAGLARGMITLQRPPVDLALVQRTAQSAAAQRRVPTPEQRAQASAQVRAQMDAASNARKSEHAQRRAQREAQNRASLQPLLADMQRQKAALAGATSSADSGQIRSRGLAPVRTFTPPPPPAITGMAIVNNDDSVARPSGSYGQPGDMVTISGTGFGNTDGEVHFIIGPLPTQDVAVAANNQLWLDTRIVAPVPLVTGVPPYAGYVYVKRLSDGVKSAPVSFQFEPQMVQSEIRVPGDFVLQQLGGVVLSPPNPASLYPSEWVDTLRMNENWFSGVTGVDRFYINTRLKNGWKVSGPAVAYMVDTGGSAAAISLGLGSDVLSTMVAFSVNPLLSSSYTMSYSLVIPIQGPSGLSPGVTCQIVSAPWADPCPTL